MNEPSHYKGIPWHQRTSLLPEDASFLGIGEGIKGIPPLVSRHLVPRCLLPRGAKGLPLNKEYLPVTSCADSLAGVPPSAILRTILRLRIQIVAPCVPRCERISKSESVSVRERLS